jgi:hypothetical protein
MQIILWGEEMDKEIKKRELFELVLPEFFDADALKTPTKITYRIDNQGERLYARKTDDNELKVVPSVSTILRNLPTSPHLLKWYGNEFPDYEAAQEYVMQRAEYGTFMHMMFKEILLGNVLMFNAAMLGESFAEYLKSIGKKSDAFNLIEVGQDLKQDLWAFVQFCNTYKVKPLAIEYIVFGDKYGGAIDLICKMTITKTRKVDNLQSERMFAFLPEAGEVVEEREVVAQVDFKSGRKEFYESNQLQLHAYRELWNQEWPQHQIEIIANYGCKNYRLPVKKSEPYRFKVYKDDANISRKWSLLVDLYHTKEIKIKDRVEFRDDAQISINSPLTELVETIEVQQQLLKRMEENASENTEREPSDETAGDREDQDRAKGGKRQRKGKANESGLF